jgi:hypothetical protein
MKAFHYLTAAFCFVSLACDDSTTSQPKHSNASAYSVSTDSCLNNNSLLKTNQNSKLSYSFSDDSILIKVFLATNCCPDKNRFVTSASIYNDSLHLIVNDTAQGLCDCICNYEIQTIVKAFNFDTLRFTCEYEDTLYLSDAIAIQ